MIDLEAARKYFKKSDAIMSGLLEQRLAHEPPLKLPVASSPEGYFRDLASAIISQQISVKAAASIWQRFEDWAGGEITPERVQTLTVENLRAVGLSHAKARYLLGIADDIKRGRVAIDKLADLADEEVIERLVQFKGIGRWSAEMFLIFSLARPDVFSLLDLGLVKATRLNYKLRPHMTRKFLKTVEVWSPHKTVASLALWHSLDNEPLLL